MLTGAVNTLVPLEGGGWEGENTDVAGFLPQGAGAKLPARLTVSETIAEPVTSRQPGSRSSLATSPLAGGRMAQPKCQRRSARRKRSMSPRYIAM